MNVNKLKEMPMYEVVIDLRMVDGEFLCMLA